MRAAPDRSRRRELSRARDAARRGHDLLERKREALQAELARRRVLQASRSAAARDALAGAGEARAVAEVEIGTAAAEAASLAQEESARVEWRARTLLGVSTPALRDVSPPFRPMYGAAGTAASLDDAGAAYRAALAALVALAETDLAVRSLAAGLRRTARRVNALEKVILPRIASDLRRIRDAVEEEERDETLRRRRGNAGNRTVT